MRLRDGKITIRPIAGTRPRGATPEEDLALEAELLADPKERAEHLMLLDLGRNDVGRVGHAARRGRERAAASRRPPRVRVTESFIVERYSHVMHIVSNVEGDAPEGLDPVDVIMAALPAGTLSGAPKVRAMQIIDELESEKRGVGYAGAAGYIGADGVGRHLHRAAHRAVQGRGDVRPGRRRRGRRQRSRRRVRGDPAQGPRPRPRRAGSLAVRLATLAARRQAAVRGGAMIIAVAKRQRGDRQQARGAERPATASRRRAGQQRLARAWRRVEREEARLMPSDARVKPGKRAWR